MFEEAVLEGLCGRPGSDHETRGWTATIVSQRRGRQRPVSEPIASLPDRITASSPQVRILTPNSSPTDDLEPVEGERSAPNVAVIRIQDRLKGVLDRLAEALERAAAEEDARRALRGSRNQLDELFLVLVVGEFNAGKSAFLNAVLGEDLLEQGPTPTTSRIHRLRWGSARHRETGPDGIEQVEAPLPRLRTTSWVDTPGTNAIDREHERITRQFVPRADFVLFVTSADRPFTESEREFLETIREWGKKVVLVVNKIDILEPEDRDRVSEFVREQGSRLLGVEPRVFALSAKQALRTETRDHSGLPELVTYLDGTLDEVEKIRLKLLNPLEVGRRLSADQRSKVESARELLREDLITLEEIERQLALFREDMEREFELRLGNVDRQLRLVENRGDEFFEETLRLGRFTDLLQKERIRREFEQKVVAEMPRDVERQVDELIDWMVDCEIRQWQGLQDRVRERIERHRERITGLGGRLDSRRQQLLESVGRSAQRAVATFEKEKEAQRLARSVQRSVAGAALLEVGAVGLGTILAAAASTAAVDVTGVIAAGALATLGLFVIPARRRRAKAELRRRLETLRNRLLGGLRDEFTAEMETMLGRLRETTGPYSRFVRAETDNLDQLSETFRSLHVELDGLADQVAEIS